MDAKVQCIVDGMGTCKPATLEATLDIDNVSGDIIIQAPEVDETKVSILSLDSISGTTVRMQSPSGDLLSLSSTHSQVPTRFKSLYMSKLRPNLEGCLHELQAQGLHVMLKISPEHEPIPASCFLDAKCLRIEATQPCFDATLESKEEAAAELGLAPDIAVEQSEHLEGDLDLKATWICNLRDIETVGIIDDDAVQVLPHGYAFKEANHDSQALTRARVLCMALKVAAFQAKAATMCATGVDAEELEDMSVALCICGDFWQRGLVPAPEDEEKRARNLILKCSHQPYEEALTDPQMQTGLTDPQMQTGLTDLQMQKVLEHLRAGTAVTRAMCSRPLDFLAEFERDVKATLDCTSGLQSKDIDELSSCLAKLDACSVSGWKAPEDFNFSCDSDTFRLKDMGFAPCCNGRAAAFSLRYDGPMDPDVMTNDEKEKVAAACRQHFVETAAQYMKRLQESSSTAGWNRHGLDMCQEDINHSVVSIGVQKGSLIILIIVPPLVALVVVFGGALLCTRAERAAAVGVAAGMLGGGLGGLGLGLLLGIVGGALAGVIAVAGITLGIAYGVLAYWLRRWIHGADQAPPAPAPPQPNAAQAHANAMRRAREQARLVEAHHHALQQPAPLDQPRVQVEAAQPRVPAIVQQPALQDADAAPQDASDDEVGLAEELNVPANLTEDINRFRTRQALRDAQQGELALVRRADPATAAAAERWLKVLHFAQDIKLGAPRAIALMRSAGRKFQLMGRPRRKVQRQLEQIAVTAHELTTTMNDDRALWTRLRKDLNSELNWKHTFHKMDGTHFATPANEFAYMTESAQAALLAITHIERGLRSGERQDRQGFFGQVAEAAVRQAAAGLAAEALTRGGNILLRHMGVPLIG